MTVIEQTAVGFALIGLALLLIGLGLTIRHAGDELSDALDRALGIRDAQERERHP